MKLPGLQSVEKRLDEMMAMLREVRGMELERLRIVRETHEGIKCPECLRFYSLYSIGITEKDNEVTLTCRCGKPLEAHPDKTFGWHSPNVSIREYVK